MSNDPAPSRLGHPLLWSRLLDVLTKSVSLTRMREHSDSGFVTSLDSAKPPTSAVEAPSE